MAYKTIVTLATGRRKITNEIVHLEWDAAYAEFKHQLNIHYNNALGGVITNHLVTSTLQIVRYQDDACLDEATADVIRECSMTSAGSAITSYWSFKGFTRYSGG